MRRFIIITLSLLFAGAAFGQSADVITEILESKEATFGQVCYISAVQQGLVEDSSNYEDAVTALQDAGQIPESISVDHSIPAVDAAFIYSQMWEIKGGLMYRITKGSPRYAFRQFQADGVISSSIEPNTLISGVDILRMYTACMRKYGGLDLTKVQMD